jgi:branched-chain amino acid transport system permease protein
LIDSRIGRALRAINGSELAAETLGVNTSKHKIQIFVLSAAFASVAGILYAHCLTFTAPETFGVMTSILLLVMAAVGGIGSFWGSIIGAIGLTILPEYLRAFKELEVLLYGIILIVVMMFMPSGLAGLLSGILRKALKNNFSA